MIEIKTDIASIMVEVGKRMQPAIQKAADQILKASRDNWPNFHPNCRSKIEHPIFKEGKKYMDIIPPESYERYQMRKWLSQVPHGGIVGCKAVLVLYNETMPERSLLIVEDI